MKIAYGLLAFAVIGSASAQTALPKTYGAWEAVDYPDKIVISSKSEEGVMLSNVCGLEAGNCSWGLLMGPQMCLQDSVIHILVSSSKGSLSTQARCTNSDDEMSALLIEDRESFTRMVTGTAFIEIALPGSDTISTLRFPTNGYNASTQAVVNKQQKR